MIKLVKGIANGFKGLIKGIEALVEGVLTLVESLGAMFEWIPELLEFGSGSFLKFIPSVFVPIVSVIMAIFIIKLVMGADNK